MKGRMDDDHAALTLDELQHGLEVAARLVAVDGEVMLPVFERFELELAAAKARAAAVERAKAIAAGCRDQGEPGEPA